MFRAGAADSRLVGNANVVGGIAGVIALALAAATLWSRRAASQATPPAGLLADAVDYLAVETVRYWRDQAKARRITTPSPAVVRWSWAGPSVAARPKRLAPTVLTQGVITRLREQLYQPGTDTGP
jgi:hypothetical protein